MIKNLLIFVGGMIAGAVVTKLYMDHKPEDEIVYRYNEEKKEEQKDGVEYRYDEAVTQNLTGMAEMAKNDLDQQVKDYVGEDIYNKAREEVEKESEKYTIEFDEAKHLPPEIVPYEAIKDLPPTVSQGDTLLYNMSICSLTDLNDEIIFNIEDTVGDCLDGFNDPSEGPIFVWNHMTNEWYEIQFTEDGI